MAATYSGYKKKHTLKYEIACNITNGIIVWAPVPGALGPSADQDLLMYYKIFDNMLEDEFYLGDGHYLNEPKSRIIFKEDMTDDISHVYVP